MPSFDPSIISQIPDMAPNPVAAKEQGLRLADLQTAQASHALNLKEQQQGAEDTQKAREILKGTKLDSQQDVTKAAEKLTNAGLPDEAMKFMKAMQGLQAGKGDLTLQQYQIMAAKADITGGVAAGLVNQYDQQIQQGVSPLTATAVMQSRYTEALKQLSQQKLPDGTPALNQQDLAMINQHPQFDPQFLRAMADKTKQGAAALKAQMEFHKQQTADKGEANRERATDIASKREEDYARSISDKEIQNRVKEANKKAAILDEEELQPMAKQYIAGDRSVMQNLGRGEAGAVNVANMRRAIRKEAKAEGLSPADLAGRLGQFNAFVAEERSVATREGAIQTAAREADKIFPIAEKQSLAVPRGDWVLMNRAVQAYEKGTSDKELAKLQQAIDTTVNVYARAVNPIGVPHEAARARALALLSSASSQDAFQGVIDIMKAEIKAALTSPDEVKRDIMRSFKQSVAPPGDTPGAIPAGSGPAPGVTPSVGATPTAGVAPTTGAPAPPAAPGPAAGGPATGLLPPPPGFVLDKQ